MPLAGQMRDLGRCLDPRNTDAAVVLGTELDEAVVRHRHGRIIPLLISLECRKLASDLSIGAPACSGYAAEIQRLRRS
jgi:hypothetical protein